MRTAHASQPTLSGGVTRALGAAAAIAALASCGVDDSTPHCTEGCGAAGGTGQGGSGGATSQGGSAGASAGGAPAAPLYVNVFDGLYRGDSSVTPLQFVDVGTFDCIPTFSKGVGSGVSDIAVDTEGNLWAVITTGGGHYSVVGASVTRIDLTTPGVARCVDSVGLEELKHFNGLSFAPRGVLAADEVLVATTDQGELWSLASNGAVTPRGILGDVPIDDGHGHAYTHPKWMASDVAFFDNDGSPVGYVLARDCTFQAAGQYPIECGLVDSLLELDLDALATATDTSVVKRVLGQTVRRTDCPDALTAYGGLMGLAALNGSLYAFAGSQAVQIDGFDASACGFEAVVDSPLDTRIWYGAASSNAAPITLD